MADADIQFVLKDALPGSVPCFTPGAVLRGALRIVPTSGALRCSHLWVCLEWHTEGSAETESAVPSRSDLFQGELPAGEARELPFRLDLPESPWSYSGHHVSIVWRLFAELVIPGEDALRAFVPVRLAPDWWQRRGR